MKKENKAILEDLIEKCEEAEAITINLDYSLNTRIKIAREYLSLAKVYFEDVYKIELNVREPEEYE